MHRCKVCGYIYDNQQGDPAQNIPPGTDFNDLPQSWRCPVCGVTADDFVEVD